MSPLSLPCSLHFPLARAHGGLLCYPKSSFTRGASKLRRHKLCGCGHCVSHVVPILSPALCPCGAPQAQHNNTSLDPFVVFSTLVGYVTPASFPLRPLFTPLLVATNVALRRHCEARQDRTGASSEPFPRRASPFSSPWHVCRRFHLVSCTPWTCVVVRAVDFFASPAEDCTAILGRPRFVALLSATAINFWLRGICLLLSPRAVLVNCVVFAQYVARHCNTCTHLRVFCDAVSPCLFFFAPSVVTLFACGFGTSTMLAQRGTA